MTRTARSIGPGATPPGPGEAGPVAVLVATPAALASVVALASAADLEEVEEGSVPTAPWRLDDRRLLCPCTGTDPGDTAHRLLLRGVHVALVPRDASDPARLVDSLRRHARIVDWRSAAIAELTPTQVQLLGELAAGRPVAEAARAVHLSLRTAHRRIAEARRTLGAATTTAACHRIVQAADQLRP